MRAGSAPQVSQVAAAGEMYRDVNCPLRTRGQFVFE